MHTFDKNLKCKFFSNDPGDFRTSFRSNWLIVPTENAFALMEFQFKNCPKKPQITFVPSSISSLVNLLMNHLFFFKQWNVYVKVSCLRYNIFFKKNRQIKPKWTMCFKLNELRCFVFIIIINLDFISLIW